MTDFSSHLPTLAVRPPAPPFSFLPGQLHGTAADIDALYVHVPFCATKCHYCDFYSLAGHLDKVDAFLLALDRELEMQAAFFTPPSQAIQKNRPRPATLFIGGGTPTLLTPAELARLLSSLHKHIDFSRATEFTIEANPNTFDADKAAVLMDHGINRISFGAQSFIPSELRMLQRDHDPESVATAFDSARRAGINNLNIDLIFGIPGQTLATWDHSLKRALELDPDHMSCYSLIYEPNTAMTARLHRGEFLQLDEDTELGMFTHVYNRLRAAGFDRYETSNYARRNSTGIPQVCRHNLAYWKGDNWMAVGPGAGAHLVQNTALREKGSPVAWQWKNVASLTHYLAALAPESGASPRLPITQMEPLDLAPWAAGVAVFWLRLSEGLHYQQFQTRTGIDPRRPLQAALARYIDLGFAEYTSTTARIRESGVAVSNRILADVLSAFEALH